MSQNLSMHEILKAVLERIPKGRSFDYSNINCHIVKVDKKEVDFWIGTKDGNIPQKVKAMMEVAEEVGYKVTLTIGTPLEEMIEKHKPEKKQVGLDRWTQG